MCGRVPKRHRAVGLSESYDLRPTYGFHAAALDRGHQPFEQSDWPSRSRDGISLYNRCHVALGRRCNAGRPGPGRLRIWAGDWDLGIASYGGSSYCEGFARILFMRSAHNK
jgi:hypothetical protein